MRFGIMCRGTVFSEWQAACIRELIEEGATPELLIMEYPKRPISPFRRRLRKIFSSHFLYWAYTTFIDKPKSEKTVDLADELEGAALIVCEPEIVGKFSQYFSELEVESIKTYKLDFVLRFAFGIIRGGILESARYGVWSFHHDDEEKYRGGPPCFWEIYHGDAVTGAILQRLTDTLDGGTILKKGFFSTKGHSYGRNLDQAHRESAYWPAAVCRDIRNDLWLGASLLRGSLGKIYRLPNNRQMVWFVLKVLRNAAHHLYRLWFIDDMWSIGVIDKHIDRLAKDSISAVSISSMVKADKNNFIADPFVVVDHYGCRHILVEHYDYSDPEARGRIYSAPFPFRVGEHPQLSPALRLPFHASYPFILEHKGHTYCIPETAEANEVAIYYALTLPSTWRKHTVLLPDVPGIDPTVFRHDGRWWLFCTRADRHSSLNLFAWFSDSLFGPWKPHLRNPIKTDVRSSRSAGTPFYCGDVLYRPAQDYSKCRQWRIVINRVARLSPTEFYEFPWTTVGPFPGTPFCDGVHTVSSAGDQILIDGKTHTFTLRKIWRSR